MSKHNNAFYLLWRKVPYFICVSDLTVGGIQSLTSISSEAIVKHFLHYTWGDIIDIPLTAKLLSSVEYILIADCFSCCLIAGWCLFLFREKTCKRLPQVTYGLSIHCVIAGGAEKGCVFQTKGTDQRVGFAARQDDHEWAERVRVYTQ